ncbi:MAG: nucleotidyltransferase family protein [Acidobacteria bacterium]|nr:nucleotidyltransferase family protein [Acidobacteriota bacterium]MBV9625863.1 nucleotidyltransferase family protein [Acidobacteriota bacterium]
MNLGMGLGGVILAAGASSRMGRDKALLGWPPEGGGTILSSWIEGLSLHCHMVLVVAGENETTLRAVVYGGGAFLVRNPAPEQGQFSSLRVGLQEVLNRGRDNAMIALVDRPPPSVETLSRLVSAFETKPRGTWAVVPACDGKHGHPIVIGREMIEAFLKAPAKANAREIEHSHGNRILYLPIEDPLVTVNVDTPEDYKFLQSRRTVG